MKNHPKTMLAGALLVMSTLASAQITFYEGQNFTGRTFRSDSEVNNFSTIGFNDRASSVIVEQGRWEVCDDAGFKGRCVVLRRGNYDSLKSMGMNDRISSVRPAGQDTRSDVEANSGVTAYEYRRRPNEGTRSVPVTSTRAVVGAASERCWTERQQVESSARDKGNVGGAVAGAVIGAILGHQIGGGVGKDLATAGGAVAGGVIGSNVGRDKGGTTEQDVRRCETTPSTAPTYWDVRYQYEGVEHRVQMSSPPGAYIEVNSNGEPRQ